MRYTILTLLLATAFTIHAQEEGVYTDIYYSAKKGYRFFDEARENIKSGNYKKAEKLLDKALQADYGFCGNSWSYIHGEINNLKAKMYISQERYADALTALNKVTGCDFGADCTTRDSLKIVALIHKFGKERVKYTLDKITKWDGELFSSEFSAFLPTFNYTFTFQRKGRHSSTQSFTDEEITAFLKEQDFYKLLLP